MAEAFYGGVPAEMAERVLTKVPVAFKKVLDAMQKNTTYGKLYFRTR
jgi:hypothetical protein